jgi:hypothetical protein
MRRALRHFVRQRAGRRCEYCHLPDSAAPAADFHVEHIIARQHGGGDAPDNRCWSRHRCNFKKAPNLSGRDPLTGNVVPLFHPRRQVWRRHFRWSRATLFGRTQTGRATIAVLGINDRERIRLRQTLIDHGEWPGD